MCFFEYPGIGAPAKTPEALSIDFESFLKSCPNTEPTLPALLSICELFNNYAPTVPILPSIVDQLNHTPGVFPMVFWEIVRSQKIAVGSWSVRAGSSYISYKRCHILRQNRSGCWPGCYWSCQCRTGCWRSGIESTPEEHSKFGHDTNAPISICWSI